LTPIRMTYNLGWRDRFFGQVGKLDFFYLFRTKTLQAIAQTECQIKLHVNGVFKLGLFT